MEEDGTMEEEDGSMVEVDGITEEVDGTMEEADGIMEEVEAITTTSPVPAPLTMDGEGEVQRMLPGPLVVVIMGMVEVIIMDMVGVGPEEVLVSIPDITRVMVEVGVSETANVPGLSSVATSTVDTSAHSLSTTDEFIKLDVRNTNDIAPEY